MIHPALAGLIDRYQPQSSKDYQNAVREIVQEIALLGLWRTPFYEHAAFYGGSALQFFMACSDFRKIWISHCLSPSWIFRSNLISALWLMNWRLGGLSFPRRELRKPNGLPSSRHS